MSVAKATVYPCGRARQEQLLQYGVLPPMAPKGSSMHLTKHRTNWPGEENCQLADRFVPAYCARTASARTEDRDDAAGGHFAFMTVHPGHHVWRLPSA